MRMGLRGCASGGAPTGPLSPADAAAPDEAAKLLQVGEAEVDVSLPPVQLAAATVVASTLLNHDEAIMRR